MSQVRDLLVSSARSIFESTVTKDVLDALEDGRFPQRVWESIDDSGLDHALVPEDRGGAGVSFADAAAILRVAGAEAAPVPLADSLVARRLIAECGLEAPFGPLALSGGAGADDAPSGRGTTSRVRAARGEAPAIRVQRGGAAFAVDGDLREVPYARFATAIVFPVVSRAGTRLVVVPRDRAKIDEGAGLTGEPRDRVRFERVRLDGALVSDPTEIASPRRVWRLGAFTRAALMSGALERILAMSVEYARERVQFGRPIGQFQAVQQELAVLAGEVAAAQAATEAAAAALDAADGSEELAVAVAKMRVGEAAGRASRIAHQVHGAIGFTQEHELHYRTRRLWAWRDEYGSETFWAERVGAAVIAAGSAGLWPLLTRTSPARAEQGSAAATTA